MIQPDLGSPDIHTYKQTCIHTCHAYIHAYTHTYIHTYTHTHIHANMHTHTHTHTHIYVHVCVYIYAEHTVKGVLVVTDDLIERSAPRSGSLKSAIGWSFMLSRRSPTLNPACSAVVPWKTQPRITGRPLSILESAMRRSVRLRYTCVYVQVCTCIYI